MIWLVRLVGIALVVEGLIVLVAPGMVLAAGRTLVNPAGLIVAAVIRVAIGGALLAASRASRFPRVFQILGIFLILAGLATPLLGVERARAIVEWFAAHGGGAIRIIGAVATAIGVFFAYAASGSTAKAV